MKKDSQTNQELKLSGQRDLLVDALNKMIDILTTHSEKAFDDVISGGLQPIARAARLNRIAVYRNYGIDHTSVGQIGQIYVWYNGKTVALDEDLHILPTIPPLIRWLSLVSTGECFNGNALDMTEDEVQFCASYGVKALLLVPVFTHGHLWGVISLEDHTNYRYFDEGCLDLLRSAARLCGNAFIRNEMAKSADESLEALKHRKNMADSLNQFAINFLSQRKESFTEMMNSGMEMIAGVVSLDRLSVWRNTLKPDGMHASQIYRWDKKSGGTTNPTPGLEDVAYSNLAPRWEQLLASNGTINGPVREMPEATVLQSFGVVSAFISPVFLNSEFWGFVLFEDRYREREFDEDSAEMMRSVAFLCVNSVIRADMEREISEVNELNRATLSIIPVGFTVFDDKLRLIDCNDTILNIFETTKHYYVTHFVEFSPEYQSDGGRSEDKIDQVHKRALRGEKFVFEWIHRSSSGELIPFEITLSRTSYKGSYIVLACQYDLRNIKKMMESIREQSELLKVALKKATVASKAKGEFLSNMSHEMRTPLNTIIGMTIIGKKAAEIERKNYALRKIEDASAHLLGVINDVLDMSKIEANKFELSPEEFSFEKMLQRVVNVVNFRMDEKQQKFTVNIDSTIPKTLIGDDQRIAQVITNLLGNAIKFTNENGIITLNTRFMSEEDGLCTLMISVSDSGIGISAEQQTRLFRSFQQAENSTVRKFGGTGLGLAICKRIVDMMGGKIWVESEPNKGSTFFFTIQLTRGTERNHVPMFSDIKIENIRILVVDDDQDILNYMSESIQALGSYCDTANNGEEALRLIQKNGPYSIYFLDWMMPDIDGIALARRIRKNTSEPDNATVIMISSARWHTIETEAKKAGVDKFLSKPLFPSDITELINQCLDMKQQQAAQAPENIENIFKGYRVLLVEDVDINREIVQALFEPTRLDIVCAENGAQAVEKFSTAPNKYDLILMDLQMPEMDGFEATRQIRAIEAKFDDRDPHKRKHIPIIAMTANVFREDVEKCLEAGMDSHLGKPLNFDEVLEKLCDYLIHCAHKKS